MPGVGAHLVVIALAACAMKLDWTSSAHSYTPGVHYVVCADTLRITNGRVTVETRGDGLFKAGFER